MLLDAFSPQSLMRRFVQYRRSHELRQPLDDAGAWQMYSHYYDELASIVSRVLRCYLTRCTPLDPRPGTAREKQRESEA